MLHEQGITTSSLFGIVVLSKQKWFATRQPLLDKPVRAIVSILVHSLGS